MIFNYFHLLTNLAPSEQLQNIDISKIMFRIKYLKLRQLISGFEKRYFFFGFVFQTLVYIKNNLNIDFFFRTSCTFTFYSLKLIEKFTL
jgi:hypothetical protein